MAIPELVKVEALRAFTLTTEWGQFHGDPNNHLEEGRFPHVPAPMLADLIDEGRVRLLDEDAPAAAPQAKPHPLDRDGDGEPGGSLPKDPTALSGKKRRDLFAIARNEGILVNATGTNAKIITAIEEARAAKAAATDQDDDGEADELDGPPA